MAGPWDLPYILTTYEIGTSAGPIAREGTSLDVPLHRLMPYTVGALVVVTTLANKRGEVVEAGRSGRYRVRVEGATIWCREADLAAPPEPARSKRGKRALAEPASAHSPGSPRSSASRPAPARRLDLHGLRVDEALARVEAGLNDALLGGADHLEIVHGKGTGTLQKAVHRYLGTLPVIAIFRLDPENPGVTRVYFR